MPHKKRELAAISTYINNKINLTQGLQYGPMFNRCCNSMFQNRFTP